MSLVRQRRPVWRRWSPRQLAIARIAEALDAAATTWPPGSTTHRALSRALRAVQTAGRCAVVEDSPLNE